jgi:pimeloyl-ACP methyl ester carboxylesterase
MTATSAPPAAPASETVLLLHGQPGAARDWEAVIEALPPRLTALAVDRPGWDGTAAGGLRRNGEAALASIDALGVRRAVVVGHSFGAAVAAWLAVHHGERVAELVLIAPAANVDSLYPVDRWLAAPLAGPLASISLMAGMAAALTLGPLRRQLARRLGLEPRFLDAAASTLRRPSAWAAFAVEQRAMIRELPDLDARLHEIAAPTTIVIGGHDRVVPPRSARRLAEQIPHAQLVELPDATHLMPMVDPSDVAKLIAAAAAGSATLSRQ